MTDETEATGGAGNAVGKTAGNGPELGHRSDGLELAKAIARGLVGKGPARARNQKRTGPDLRSPGGYSGPHPDERDPQALDSTMGRLVAERGWSADVRVNEVITRWGAIVGHAVAQHCTPETFDEEQGLLVVRAQSTTWATELKLQAPTMVRRFAEELGDGLVTRIEVLGPTGPSWKKGRLSVRDGRGPRDTYG